MLLRHGLLSCLLSVAASAQSSSGLLLTGLLDRAIERSQTELRRTDIWEDHSTWETAWRVRSGRYEVRRAGGFAKAKGLADFLERKLQIVENAMGQPLPKTGEPLKVFVLPSLAAYREFGDEHGEEHSSFYGSFFASGHPDRPVAMHGDKDWARQYAVHSAVHQYLNRAFPGGDHPLWIEEGLASYFSLCHGSNLGWARSQFLNWRGDDEAFIPLRSLLSDPIARYGQGQPLRRFVQLGILFWYLLDVRDDARTRDRDVGPFRDYLVLRLRGQSGVGHEMHWLSTSRADRLDLERELRTEDLKIY